MSSVIGVPEGLGQDIELEPDTDQIVQTELVGDEEPFARIPVDACIDGVVKIQAMPSRASRIRTVRIPASGQLQILPPDPRRRRALISASGSFYIGNTKAQAADDMTRFLLPVGAALPCVELTTTDEIWAGAGSEVLVYIYTEQWAN